jgi:DnaJ-class molecular chaperone
MTRVRRDHYEVLGVPPNASAQQIQHAFRTRARELHPDISEREGAAARFQELSTAYEVLHDPAERARYDHGAVKVQRRQSPPRRQRPSFSSPRPRHVPRFLDGATIEWVWGPIMIRLSSVFRWLR